MIKASDIFGTSSGGGTPVNGIRPLYLPGLGAPDLYQDTSGHTWLKTGSVETDYSRYPDADIKIGLTFTGAEHALGISDAQGGCFDGTHYWIAKLINTNIGLNQYTRDWVKTGVVINPSDHIGNVRDVTFDGSYLYVCGNDTDVIAKYDLDGTYISKVDVSSFQGNIFGLHWTGTHFLACGNIPAAVQRLDSDFNEVSSFETYGTVNSPNGVIELPDGRFLITQESGDKVWVFHADGTYSGTSVAFPGTTPTGLFTDGDRYYVVSRGSQKVYEFLTEYIGDEIAHTDTDTGYPLYVRIG
jgi:hypothetical protein